MVRKTFLIAKGADRGWCSRWASIVGNHYCIVHLSIITMPMVFSLMYFNMAAPTGRKGRKNVWAFQLKLKVFTAMPYESGIQEIYLFIGLLRQVANRTICGLNWNFSQFVREHPFCIAMEDPKHFVCNCVLNTRNVAWRNPEASLPWNSHICFAILFREQNVPLPCC